MTYTENILNAAMAKSDFECTGRVISPGEREQGVGSLLQGIEELHIATRGKAEAEFYIQLDPALIEGLANGSINPKQLGFLRAVALYKEGETWNEDEYNAAEAAGLEYENRGDMILLATSVGILDSHFFADRA